jgi:cyclophilin family peptidyl-prolyl cis-trans isomerase
MADLENTLYLDVASANGEAKGRVTIALRPDLAPNHVARIKELAREGAYDGVVFHRVIEGFMAQGGDVQFGNTSSASFNPAGPAWAAPRSPT